MESSFQKISVLSYVKEILVDNKRLKQPPWKSQLRNRICNTWIDTFHEHEAGIRSPREATKFSTKTWEGSRSSSASLVFLHSGISVATTGFLPWWARFSKLCNIIILHIISQVVCKLFQDQDFEKRWRPRLGIEPNQRQRERGLLAKSERRPIKKNLSWCKVCQHLQAGK